MTSKEFKEIVEKQNAEIRARMGEDLWETVNYIKSAKAVIEKLNNKGVHKEDSGRDWSSSWDYLLAHAGEDPKAYLEDAVDDFYDIINKFAGPAHCKLSFDSETPVDMTEVEKHPLYPDQENYGGGLWYCLDEFDIKFLNDNGYVVVMGPKGPECRVDKKRLPRKFQKIWTRQQMRDRRFYAIINSWIAHEEKGEN